MPRRSRITTTTTTLIVLILSVAVFTLVSLHRSHDAIPCCPRLHNPNPIFTHNPINRAIKEERPQTHHHYRHQIPDSILLPGWEVLLVVSSPWDLSPGDYSCVFFNNATSPAKRSWTLPSTNQTTFTCVLPPRARRRRRLLKPALARSDSDVVLSAPEGAEEMFRWNFLTYESFSTAHDVVLFAKGVNHRQGVNRPVSELSCVFLFPDLAIRTAVTSSAQEVFRCPHPSTQMATNDVLARRTVRVSLEISVGREDTPVRVPTVARYLPRQVNNRNGDRALLCACTMVYNVAKFLREWVVFHSEIGIDRFILYDNGSDDDLEETIREIRVSYDVQRVLWPWPKTQEAGFSHCAVNAKQSCQWMAFIDVDEFIFSPNWMNLSNPSTQLLRSLLPNNSSPTKSTSNFLSPWPESLPPVGEISINCNEFGPSEQAIHPVSGVTQGYTCRKRMGQRHKSIVQLDAIDDSLLNVIHHFRVKEDRFRTKNLESGDAIVNHYKYQAWPEFKAKFRRRVSAYVVDWTQELNPESKDRTPGLGFEAVEPSGWAQRFCEIRDERLKNMTARWFGRRGESGFRMAWER